eukprot:882978-Rhodomonas_salina.3
MRPSVSDIGRRAVPDIAEQMPSTGRAGTGSYRTFLVHISAATPRYGVGAYHIGAHSYRSDGTVLARELGTGPRAYGPYREPALSSKTCFCARAWYQHRTEDQYRFRLSSTRYDSTADRLAILTISYALFQYRRLPISFAWAHTTLFVFLFSRSYLRGAEKHVT